MSERVREKGKGERRKAKGEREKGKVGASRLRAFVVAVFAAGLLLTFAAPFPVIAQPASGASTSDRTDLPLMALFPHKPADPKKREDPNRALFETLRGMLVTSNKFSVVTYSPNHPIIKRALLERTLAASELAREPLPPEVKHHVARLLGARYILSFRAEQNDMGLQTDAQCEESVGQQDWHTLFTEQMTTAKTAGRKRLKFDDVIRIAADGILTRLGIPSQLSANLRPNPNETPTPPKNDTANTTPKNTTPKNDAPKTVAKNNEKPPVSPDRPKTTPPDEKTTKPDDKTPSRVADKTNKPEKQPVKTEKQPARTAQANPRPPAASNDATFAPFTTDNEPGRANDPMPQAVAPTVVARPDFEAAAARFRQSGEIASVITALRRAINDRPYDPALRRQLIKAYLERRLTDTALAEVDRALLLSPEDAAMHRLRGDCLMMKADVPGAQQAYREAMRLTPSDIAAQVALADSLMADNQFAEAMKVYAAAARNDPKSPLPHRRLARALAGRAAADTKQYALSLSELEAARKLTPPADTETYLEDYVSLMRMMEARLRDIVMELQGNYEAKIQAKQTDDQLLRTAQDIKERTEAAADYLEKMPPAIGQEATHARYQQASALLLQAVSFYREWLQSGETRLEESLKGAQTDTLRELATARKRLDAIPPKK